MSSKTQIKITPKYIQNASAKLDEAKKLGIPFTKVVQRSYDDISYDVFEYYQKIEILKQWTINNMEDKQENERIKRVKDFISNKSCPRCGKSELFYDGNEWNPVCKNCDRIYSIFAKNLVS